MAFKNPNFTLEDTTYFDLNQHIDGYISAYLDGWETSYDLSPESIELIWEFISNKYTSNNFPSDYAAWLHATTFLNFLSSKIKSTVIEKTDKRNFIFFAAHGGTIAGIMAAVE